LAGVVTHHALAAPLIAGFFQTAAQQGPYDTVVIVAPNHQGDIAGIVTSPLGWDLPGGVACQRDLVTALLRTLPNIARDDGRVAEDHSASVLIPFIHHALPDARVAPLLVSRSLSLADTLGLAQALLEWSETSGKRVLLVCSVDFSHYLTPAQARQNDAATLETLLRGDYRALRGLPNTYTDCPAALIVFHAYTQALGLEITALDHTDASAFTQDLREGTTGYYVLAAQRPGTAKNPQGFKP
jgi:AmmeMemoRadiSam system protein B